MSAGSVYGGVLFTSGGTLSAHAPCSLAGNKSSCYAYPMAQPALTIEGPIIGSRCGPPVHPVEFVSVLAGVMNSVRAFSGVNSASCSHDPSCISNACVPISPPACPPNCTGDEGFGQFCLGVVVLPPCPATSACPSRSANPCIFAFCVRSFLRPCTCLIWLAYASAHIECILLYMHECPCQCRRARLDCPTSP